MPCHLLTVYILFDDDLVGAEEGIAKNILEACNWDVEMAINMYVDSNLSASAPSASSSSARPANNAESIAAVEPMQRLKIWLNPCHHLICM